MHSLARYTAVPCAYEHAHRFGTYLPEGAAGRSFEQEAGRYRAKWSWSVSLGIAPIKAMLGTIRLADRVVVRFDFERGA